MHRKLTSYAPKTQGYIEKINRAITSALAMYCSSKQNNWYNCIRMCVFAINTSVQDTTKFTPSYLTCGRQPTLLTEIALTNFENGRTEAINLEDYTVKLNDALESSREVATAEAEEFGIKMSMRYEQLHQYINSKKEIWFFV